jgi:hypothetical protein
MKSVNSEAKAKSVTISEKEEPKQTMHTFDRTNRSQQKPVTAKKSRDTYSNIDKEEPHDAFSNIDETGHSELIERMGIKDKKAATTTKGFKGNLPPRSTYAKGIHPEAHTIAMRPSIKEDSKGREKKSIDKEIHPRTVQVVNKARSVILDNGSEDELVFVPAKKEISFQFLSKYQ